MPGTNSRHAQPWPRWGSFVEDHEITVLGGYDGGEGLSNWFLPRHGSRPPRGLGVVDEAPLRRELPCGTRFRAALLVFGPPCRTGRSTR